MIPILLPIIAKIMACFTVEQEITQLINSCVLCRSHDNQPYLHFYLIEERKIVNTGVKYESINYLICSYDVVNLIFLYS